MTAPKPKLMKPTKAWAIVHKVSGNVLWVSRYKSNCLYWPSGRHARVLVTEIPRRKKP